MQLSGMIQSLLQMLGVTGVDELAILKHYLIWVIRSQFLHEQILEGR